MLLIQFFDTDNHRRVGLVNDDRRTVTTLAGYERTYQLAHRAGREGTSIADLAQAAATGPVVDYDALIRAGRVLVPFDHPDPAHCFVTGTGLTHLGSAQARDGMHAKATEPDEETLTDSMKLFRWGLERGKPKGGGVPVQPEWFYKGDGSFLVAPGSELVCPPFAEDGGDEAELVGLYLNSDDGVPLRVGFALGNEFSDHVMERHNYLYLAHSKLRQSSFGPELLVGDLPESLEGTIRVLRDGEEVFSAPFNSGEENMSYTIPGLEHHHFKYSEFRRPGDVHCHYFGASVLSFASGFRAENGDVFEIAAPPFSRPLRNALRIRKPAHEPIAVRQL